MQKRNYIFQNREAFIKKSVNNILFSQDIWQDDSESVPDPWKVVHMPNIMLLFFASNNKLFKIVFLEEYEGTLSNGISTNMVLNEARRIDNSIQYNDWDEIYESEGGYWIEVSTGEETIMSISVFIKEIDDEKFELGLW